MKLSQIRYFVAVAEEQSFSAAARRLHISQPPITRQIQQLEKDMEVHLFTRTKKGVELTPAGKVFLIEARKIISISQHASEKSRAAERGEIGKFEIAYFGSSIFSIIPKALHLFCQDNKSVEISLQPMRKKDQIIAIQEQRLHLGFGRYYPNHPEIIVETVGFEKILLALSTTHPLAKKKSISPKQLSQEPIIAFPCTDRPSFADDVIRILRSADVEPNIEYEAPDLTTALALTASEMGVCPVPESVSQLNWANISLIPISGLKAKCPLSCIYHSRHKSQMLDNFLAVVRNVSPSK